MTNPTITCGHGHTDDCISTTAYTEERAAGMTDPDTTFSVDAGDIFNLQGVCDNYAVAEWFGEYKTVSVSTTLYPRYLILWKTGVSANGMGAKVNIHTNAGNHFVVGTEGATQPPEFDTSWHMTTGTLTAGETIDLIEFYAAKWPLTVNSGTYNVYYDFLLLRNSIFTFPFISGHVEMDMENLFADLDLLQRGGNESQYLGLRSPQITITGEMDTNTLWGSNPIGNSLYKLFHEPFTSPFEWFTSDIINCKVTPRRFTISQSSDSKGIRTFTCQLKKFDRSSGTASPWTDNSWYGF
jgi:hypothetical protein